MRFGLIVERFRESLCMMFDAVPDGPAIYFLSTPTLQLRLVYVMHLKKSNMKKDEDFDIEQSSSMPVFLQRSICRCSQAIKLENRNNLF